MTDTSHAAVVERYVAAYNAFDVDAMLALLTDDIHFENHAEGRLTAKANGIAAFRELAQYACTLFATREQRIARLDTDGNRAVAAIDYSGTLASDIPGGPVAGSTLELAGTTEFTFRGGRICKLVDRS